MRLSKKPLYALYFIDAISVVLFLFIHLKLCGVFGYPNEDGVEAFLMMSRVALLYGGILCIILTVLFKCFFKDISAEFKCVENRIAELEKNLENIKSEC